MIILETKTMLTVYDRVTKREETHQPVGVKLEIAPRGVSVNEDASYSLIYLIRNRRYDVPALCRYINSRKKSFYMQTERFPLVNLLTYPVI